jgi:putative hemolysin
MDFLFEAGVILALLVANGIFAMAEIAVVSSRKTKLRSQAEAGDRKARRALELAESPNRFLSTVQVGITLVGIIAGAYGGASLSEKVAAPLESVPWLAQYAKPLAFALVVLSITYLSLVIGELVPKRVGLSNPEKVSALLAGPMMAISKIAKPLVLLLSASSDGIMKLLGLKETGETAVTAEDLRLLAREGLRVGELHKSESEMVERVLSLDMLTVRDLMTPRPKIIWIQQDDPHEAIWHKVVVSGHTTFPVYDRGRDNIVGIVSIKSIYAHLAAGIAVKIKDLMTPPLFVPPSQNALALLETFKKTGKHVAIAIDEYGSVAGLVALHDVMEAIAGDFPTQDARLRPVAKQRDDGSWLIDAMIPIEEFEAAVKDVPIDPINERDYTTFGGFIVKHFGRVPNEGDSIPIGPYQVEIIDMDHLRVDKVLLIPTNKSGPV